MKRVFLFFVTILVSCLFFSCRSVRVIDIETYNPAAITFPPEIKTVMIINNSAQQPSGIGHRYVNNLNTDSLENVSADSTAYKFCVSLGKIIAESPLFYDVRICEDTLRRDSLFYDVKPFTSNAVKSLCVKYGVDALISLDKLFFSSTHYENKERKFVRGKAISSEVVGELRVLWPGQKEVYTIPFIDSMEWHMGADYNEAILEVITMPDTKSSMMFLSVIVGQKMSVNFVPHWSDDKRWFYTNISSDWKRGTVYAVAEKWEEAAEAWEPLYGKVKKWEHKAKLASNLALCNELAGNFEKAVEYAEISYALFKEFAGNESDYLRIQNTYVVVLKKRQESDKMLSKQLRE